MMPSISASQVMQLRQQTGVSMMACKEALVKADGDFQKALEILQKLGETQALKKAERAVNEGIIALAVNPQRTQGVMVKLLCETDFVARNQDFIKLGEKIAKLHLETVGQGFSLAKEDDKLIKEAIVKIGENLKLGEIVSLQGEKIGDYVHSNRKLGALVCLEGGSDELAHDLAMQITAMDPENVQALLKQDFIKEGGKTIAEVVGKATVNEFKRMGI